MTTLPNAHTFCCLTFDRDKCFPFVFVALITQKVVFRCSCLSYLGVLKAKLRGLVHVGRLWLANLFRFNLIKVLIYRQRSQSQRESKEFVNFLPLCVSVLKFGFFLPPPLLPLWLCFCSFVQLRMHWNSSLAFHLPLPFFLSLVRGANQLWLIPQMQNGFSSSPVEQCSYTAAQVKATLWKLLLISNDARTQFATCRHSVWLRVSDIQFN